jgi:hypothetical protein
MESDNREVHVVGVPVPGRQPGPAAALARDSRPAAALGRDSRPAAALGRDSRAWLLAGRDNHVELQVEVVPAASWRLLWEETVAAWIANRSAANVKSTLTCARTVFSCYLRSLSSRALRYTQCLPSDIHTRNSWCYSGAALQVH